ncbi:MAG: MFS transporter [Elusimicrobia bacterium]|nr:MFS transporter [Elusimicrobiota bacterium]
MEAVTGAKPQGFMASFFAKFLVLRSAARELWVIFGVKILAILAYGLVNSTLVLWLSSDLGLSDVKAGFVVSTWSTVMTLTTVMVGALADAVGIRRAFLLGLAFCVVSRAVMSFSTMFWIVLLLGLFPLAVGEALQTPVLVAAVKRYSTTAQRSMAFSVYYAMMNVGFALAGWSFDHVRGALGEYGHYRLPVLGASLSTYEVIIFLGCLCTVPVWFIVFFGLRPGVEVTDEGIRMRPEESKYSGRPVLEQIQLSCRDAVKDWVRIFGNLWSQPAFYRFLLFLTLAVGVRLILYHMYYTFPKFAIRELGPGAPVGRLFLVINPVLIVILAPVIGALTQKVSAYKAVVIGSTITAISVFFLALPPAVFKPLADGMLGDLIAHRWLGVKDAVVNPYFISIAFMAVVYSIGEAFWSPRLYEYPAAIAPKGQEASYMALSMLPYFIAKFFAGGLSGALLQAYCPAQGPRQPSVMWLIVGVMALATPIGLLVLKPWIRVHESGRED